MSPGKPPLPPEVRTRRRARRLAIARHAAEHLQCCQDATSIRDWRLFRRHHPDDWARVVRDCFQVEPEPGVTLGEYLAMGAGGLSLARDRLDTTVEKKRKAARHIAVVLGHLTLEKLDEEGLERARSAAPRAPAPPRSPAAWPAPSPSLC